MAKVTGIKEANAKMSALINDITGKKAVRAITGALIIGSTQAALYTPIDTSTLLNSQYRKVDVRGKRLIGEVGYTASYAAYVNDPKVRQNFRRATAKKEFLKLSFDDRRSAIDAFVKQEMGL